MSVSGFILFYAWFHSFKAVEVKFWSFLVCLCVWVWFLNVVKTFARLSTFFFFVKQPNQKTIQSQWTCAVPTHKKKCFVVFNSFFVLFLQTNWNWRYAQPRSIYLHMSVWAQFSRMFAASVWVWVCLFMFFDVWSVILVFFLLRSLFHRGVANR